MTGARGEIPIADVDEGRLLRSLDPLCSQEVKWARAKAWCVTALGVVAISGCRFRYEQLEVLSSGNGGVATNGGDAASAAQSFGGTSGASSGAPPSVDGGANSTEEGGAGGAVEAGGVNGAAGGTTGGTGTAGGTTGGTGAAGGTTGAGGGPGICVPDATCSCGVFQGHDYRFCSVLATRAAGATACQSANMVLVRVDSADENAWLLQQCIDHGMFLGNGGQIVFLGGNDLQVAGQWRWDDGTLFWDGGPVGSLYNNFAFAPKNSQGACVGMTSDGLWSNRSCDSSNATAACESP